MYRVAFDFQNQTVDGSPATGTLPNRNEWWAFRSACGTTGCVAVAAQLVEGNHEQTTGIAIALHFSEGRWQETTIQPPDQCATGPDSDVSTISWSLVPQSDGSLRGVGTRTIITDQCGVKGKVYKTPLSGARTSDVPPNIITQTRRFFSIPSRRSEHSP